MLCTSIQNVSISCMINYQCARSILIIYCIGNCALSILSALKLLHSSESLLKAGNMLKGKTHVSGGFFVLLYGGSSPVRGSPVFGSIWSEMLSHGVNFK